MNRAAAAALAAIAGVLAAGVPLRPLLALASIAVAALLGFRAREISPFYGACVGFASAALLQPGGDWKIVAATLLGALATTRWYAAAIVAATALFFFA